MRRRLKRAASRVPILREEWDFSKVAPDELQACYYYELARESASIRALFQRFADKNVSANDEFMLDAISYSSDAIFLGFQNGSVSFERPWQRIPRRERRDIVDAEMSRKHEAVTFLEHEGRNKPALGVDTINGVEWFRMGIRWRDFSADEIVKQFERFIREHRNRPKQWLENPRKRGNKKTNRWLNLLDRLSIMRLIHTHTASELRDMAEKNEIPRWFKFRDPHERAREAKLAVQDFRRHLHEFIPSTELPLSAPGAK